jgi:hypothetical protein
MVGDGVSALQQATERSNRRVRELRKPLEILVEEGSDQMLIDSGRVERCCSSRRGKMKLAWLVCSLVMRFGR